MDFREYEFLGALDKFQIIISQITEAHHLTLLGNVVPIVPRVVPERFLDDTGIFEGLSTVQIVAIGLLIRVTIESDTCLAGLLCIVKSRRFKDLPDHFRVTLLLKLIRATVLFKCIRKFSQTGLVQSLYKSNSAAFQLPLLYLAAEAREPVDLSPALTRQHVRFDALAAYYAGVNKLLLRRFEDADAHLRDGWTLSKGAKDIRRAVLTGRSLSAFLSRKSFRVFQARVARKYIAESPDARKVWALGTGFRAEIAGLDALFRDLITDICQEHSRRVVLDVCLCMSTVPVTQLDKLVEGTSLAVLKKLKETGEIDYEVSGGVVTLRRPAIGPRVAAELRDLPTN
jgi:hypothetical protein